VSMGEDALTQHSIVCLPYMLGMACSTVKAVKSHVPSVGTAMVANSDSKNA